MLTEPTLVLGQGLGKVLIFSFQVFVLALALPCLLAILFFNHEKGGGKQLPQNSPLVHEKQNINTWKSRIPVHLPTSEHGRKNFPEVSPISPHIFKGC